MNKQTSTHTHTHTHTFICLFIYFKEFKPLELLPLQSIQKKTTLPNSVLYLLTTAETV
jgi:hypothetical protein